MHPFAAAGGVAFLIYIIFAILLLIAPLMIWSKTSILVRKSEQIIKLLEINNVTLKMIHEQNKSKAP